MHSRARNTDSNLLLLPLALLLLAGPAVNTSSMLYEPGFHNDLVTVRAFCHQAVVEVDLHPNGTVEVDPVDVGGEKRPAELTEEGLFDRRNA